MGWAGRFGMNGVPGCGWKNLGGWGEFDMVSQPAQLTNERCIKVNTGIGLGLPGNLAVKGVQTRTSERVNVEYPISIPR